MGAWNTLHLFDSKKFYNIIVPDLMGDGRILQHYFNSNLGRFILWDNVTNKEIRINNILKLCKEFASDFKVHPLYKSLADQDTFLKMHIEAIEDLNRIIQLIVFSECALFTPCFKLGKRLLAYFVDFNKMNAKTIASECLDSIRFSESGSLHSSIGNGIVNWLTDDEVKYLLDDYSNIIPQEAEDYSDIYISELRSFLQIASENSLGVISMVNIDETTLDMIKTTPIKLSIGKYNLENFIYR